MFKNISIETTLRAKLAESKEELAALAEKLAAKELLLEKIEEALAEKDSTNQLGSKRGVIDPLLTSLENAAHTLEMNTAHALQNKMKDSNMTFEDLLAFRKKIRSLDSWKKEE